MRVPGFWLLLAVLLIPHTSHADDHFADWFVGFSWAQGSTLLGGHTSLALTLPNSPGHDASIVGDFSVHVDPGDAEITRLSLLGGGKWYFGRAQGTTPTTASSYLPSAHALVGILRNNGGPDDGTGFALAIGAALEHVPPRIRASGGWSWRAQVDVIRGGGSTFPRASIGLLKRF